MRGYGMKATDFESFLLGRTIIGVYDTGDSDCGLILELSGASSCGRLKGLCLYFGYSSCEGETIIVSKEDHPVFEDKEEAVEWGTERGYSVSFEIDTEATERDTAAYLDDL